MYAIHIYYLFYFINILITQTMRTITVVATKNGKIKKYQSNASTWGELKTLIIDDYDLSNLKPTENINKTTLEHNDAILPDGDFRLFLRPAKTKSGADLEELKRNELIQIIQDMNNGLEEKILRKQGTNNLVFVSKKALIKAIKKHQEKTQSAKFIIYDLEKAVTELNSAHNNLYNLSVEGENYSTITEDIANTIERLNNYIDMLEKDGLLALMEDDIISLEMRKEVEDFEKGFDEL